MKGRRREEGRKEAAEKERRPVFILMEKLLKKGQVELRGCVDPGALYHHCHRTVNKLLQGLKKIGHATGGRAL